MTVRAPHVTRVDHDAAILLGRTRQQIVAWRDADGHIYALLPEGQYETDAGEVLVVYRHDIAYRSHHRPVDLGHGDPPPLLWSVASRDVTTGYLDQATGEEIDAAEYIRRRDELWAWRFPDDDGGYTWAGIEHRHAWERFQANVVAIRVERHVTRTPINIVVRDLPRSDRACITPLRRLQGGIDDPRCVYEPPLRAMLDAARSRTGLDYELDDNRVESRDIRFMRLADRYIDWEDREIRERAREAGIHGFRTDERVVHGITGSYEECVARHDAQVAFFDWLFLLYRGAAMRDRRLEDAVGALEWAGAEIARGGDVREAVMAAIRRVLEAPTEASLHQAARLGPGKNRKRRR